MLTPDFETYPMEPAVISADAGERWVTITWADGITARFHHEWLRDNCPCTACVHPVTKEQIFELVSVAAGVRPNKVAPGDSGGIEIVWAEDDHHSAFHPGWLLAHRYDRPAPRNASVGLTVWDASTPGLPPTFDGSAILSDDDAVLEWLIAVRDLGVGRLRNIPLELDAVADVAARVGIVRETNFGRVFDVRSEADPISNANTGLSLPPHVDLATREYQPGLQFLHCLENSAGGGAGRYVDGYRVAEVIRDAHPDHFRALTTVRWQWANRSPSSDYRWASTPFVLDEDDNVVEVRIGNWLRAPLHAEFDDIEAAYAAYRCLFEVTYRDDLAVTVHYEPGDLLAFDNRRILHGRDTYDHGGGRRFLRGCYGEREELHSRIRTLERAQRRRRALP